MIGLTGVTGLVGYSLCKRLVEHGYKVRALVRNPNAEILCNLQVEHVIGDLNNHVALNKLCKGLDTIIHLAAVVSIFKKDKNQVFETNIQGVQNLVDVSNKHNVQRFIHFSSVHAHEAYGPVVQIDETTPYSKDPEFFYDYSKAQGEAIVLSAR